MPKSTRLLGIVAIAAVLLLRASPAHATIIIAQGFCNPSDGCDQSVNFTPANSGTTVTGDTNPPKPLYDVFVESLESLTLHGSGSTVDTGVGGSGFQSILIFPEAGFQWGAFEFQLDAEVAAVLGDLTITAWDQFGNTFTATLGFPYEGNLGENQHYVLRGTNGEFITKVQLDSSVVINDIHNIDLNTVPEPATLSLLGLGLAGAALRRRKLQRVW